MLTVSLQYMQYCKTYIKTNERGNMYVAGYKCWLTTTAFKECYQFIVNYLVVQSSKYFFFVIIPSLVNSVSDPVCNSLQQQNSAIKHNTVLLAQTITKETDREQWQWEWDSLYLYNYRCRKHSLSQQLMA